MLPDAALTHGLRYRGSPCREPGADAGGLPPPLLGAPAQGRDLLRIGGLAGLELEHGRRLEVQRHRAQVGGEVRAVALRAGKFPHLVAQDHGADGGLAREDARLELRVRRSGEASAVSAFLPGDARESNPDDLAARPPRVDGVRRGRGAGRRPRAGGRRPRRASGLPSRSEPPAAHPAQAPRPALRREGAAPGLDTEPVSAPELHFLGHSTVRVELAGRTVLTDPLLTATVGPLRRVVPPPAASAWAGVDLVLLSHLHGDHLRPPSLRLLGDVRTVVPRGAGPWLRDKGFAHVEELAPGETLRDGDLTITGVHARHSGHRWGPRLEHGPQTRAMGHLLSSRGDDGATTRVYCSGDTDLFDSMTFLGDL